MDEERGKFLENISDIFKNIRIWILIIFLVISFVAINPSFERGGVVINGISPISPAEISGISFDPRANLRSLERIREINGISVNSEEEYYEVLNSLQDSNTLRITTNKNPNGYVINTENISREGFSENLGISVRPAPNSNIRLGIELEGGSRLILSPTHELDDQEFELLVNTLQSRLDVYGASGTRVNSLQDAFSNEKFVIVESISSNKNDIFELIRRQGEFEAVFNNVSIFTGDNVLRVLTGPSNEILQGCSPSGTGYVCTYAFSIEIDGASGDRFFEQAQSVPLEGGYLAERIYFYLDGQEMTALNVASSFKFQRITNPQITVSGSPMPTERQAIDSAKREMEFLQAILSTQSLPSELEVVQSYSISSSLGEELLKNALWVGIFAILLVASIVALRYREIGVFVAIMIALIAELIIVFGVAAFMRLSIDLAAIGGLIAAIGTGVDDQIIITDEYYRKRKKSLSTRKRIKGALGIIMIAYFTTLVAMIPLYFAGLKLLQGFAFMIIIGITIGVFITRPAYAIMLRHLTTSRKLRKKESDEED